MKFASPCLTHVSAFTEGSTNKVYLYLEYQYTDLRGNVHQYILPKVEIPIPINRIPVIQSVEEDLFSRKTTEKWLIPIVEEYLSLHPGDIELELETGQIVQHRASYFDRVIKWNDDRKEMTLSDIERKLGYKIKIVGED